MLKIKLILLLLIAVLTSTKGVGQKSIKINQYSLGFEVFIGHSFPNVDSKQDRWKGVFYPVGGLSALLMNRFHPKWMLDGGIGMTVYALVHKGPVDSYVFDFASPHAVAGISYAIRNRKGQEYFIKQTAGVQIGYRGSFVDEFETYKVTVKGTSPVYPYIRPEIGIRRYFKKRKKGTRYKMAYEVGAYFRYNFKSLGVATIEETDFALRIEPKGNMIGFYVKLLSPLGRKSVRIKKQEKEFAPIIYSPRHLSTRI